MKNKLITTIVCTAMIAGSLIGCSNNANNSSSSSASGAYNTDDMPEVTLVYAEVNPLDTIAGRMAIDFKTKAEELSGGKVKIKIQPGGVLGSEDDVLNTMMSGSDAIDISRISAFALTNRGGHKSMLLSLPYTFVNSDHFWKFTTSDLAQEFLIEPEESGYNLRGLCYGEEGFRHFFTVEEITGVEDLKGMKIRVFDDPIMTELVETLGAFPVVLSFNEMYSSLQNGVVDGAEQPIANYKSNEFEYVAPNLILDGHTLGAIQIVITDQAWNELTEAEQDIIMEAAKYASQQNRKNSEDEEKEVLEQLRAEGINIIEVTDITPWQEAAKKVIENHIIGEEDLYQQILDMAH